MSILKLENVGYRYKDAPKDSYVFKNVNYEFEQGKMYAIKGKSGSGKTTLLSLITGLEKCTDGKVLYDGKDLKKMNLDTYRNTDIGIVFQSYNLLPIKKLGISYIIAVEKEINFPETLEKFKNIYGIETLVLTGGAIINGVFHEKALIDEISLVVGPYIEGNHEFKGFAELNNYTNYCYKFKKANPMQDGGVQLIFAKD